MLKPVNEPEPGRIIDIEMLVMTNGGRQRTADDLRRLFVKAGLRLDRIVPLSAGAALVEALPS